MSRPAFRRMKDGLLITSRPQQEYKDMTAVRHTLHPSGFSLYRVVLLDLLYVPDKD